MEIQDAKQARPHCELIAELLDSRQPKTEREHAAVREIERLRHDIERHIAIASEHATECERLRAELAEYKRDAERYRAVRYANVHNIDPDYQGVMNDEMPVFEQMEDLDKVVDGLKVKVDAALAAKEE